MVALLGLIAVAGYQNRDKIAEMIGGLGGKDSHPGGQPAQRDSVEDVRGAPGGIGGLLSSGLRELVERFQQNGRGDVAQSWVNRGPNQDIEPEDLRSAIGPDALAALSQRTGLAPEEVLRRLAQQLPSAIDKYTPDGRRPA
jgi:uncharacterized protein YidB (DUF937 family)